MAHRALEQGQPHDFVGEILELWLHVVVPLEGPYESLHTLELSEAPNSGFVAALPYVYENVARMVLLRSQKMGLDRALDPLGALVRVLADGRVGSHPDVIPVEASSLDYLTRIEALRVSIGLEAYAQRDPLVQYKSKASEMFTQLVEDIRGLVISRVFAYQPRPVEITPVETTNAPAATAQSVQTDQSKKKKRRRH